jgi:prephenate dehydratase
MKKITYLGPTGSWSELAALGWAEELSLEAEPCSSKTQVVKRVADGKADRAVLPYRNSDDGTVKKSLDLIFKNHLRALAARSLEIVPAIAKYPGSTDLSVVYSHPVQLGQCSEYIDKELSDRILVSTQSTSEAVEMVKEKKSGLVIARPDVLKRDLEVIAYNIANRKNGDNITDFYLLTRSNLVAEPEEGKEYLTMIAVTPHINRKGLVHDITGVIRFCDLDMTDIESRPSLEKVPLEGKTYMFYIEIDAHESTENMQKCIRTLEEGLKPEGKDVEVVRILGCYEKPTL